MSPPALLTVLLAAAVAVQATEVFGPASRPTALSDGVSVGDHVADGNMTYYYIDFETHSFVDLRIVASLFQGDVDILVNLDTKIKVPTKDAHDYHGRTNGGEAQVHVQDGDSKLSTNCPKATAPACVATIAVRGEEDVNRFALVGLVGSVPVVELTPGFMFGSVQPDTTACYYYSRRSNDNDLLITLTPYLGDPDLYVSLETSKKCPAPSSATWSSITVGVEEVVIPKSSCPSLPCDYGLTIAPYGGSAAYFGILVANASEPTFLVDGEPQAGVVPYGQYDFYQWDFLPSYKSMKLIMLPLSGDPDLFINIGSHDMPTVANYDRALLSSSGVEYFELSRTDPLFTNNCPQTSATCRLSLSVYGYQRNSSYDLVVQHDHTSVRLQDGVPQVGIAHMNEYVYYFYDLVNTQDTLVLTVTANSGDPDLFVSNTNPLAGGENSTWLSTTIGDTMVTIPPTDPNAKSCPTSPCRYYLAIRGWQGIATFTVLADARATGVTNTTTHLLDGIPQAGTVMANTFQYFELDTRAAATDSKIDLEIVSTALSRQVSLYVNDRTDAAGRPIFPTLAQNATTGTKYVIPGTYRWSSSDFHAAERIWLQGSEYKHGGRIIIGVLPDPVTTDADFMVIATTGDYISTLVDGVGQLGAVLPGYFRYYLMHLSVPNKDVLVTVSTSHGIVDVYASQTYSRPTYPSNYTWTSGLVYANAHTFVIPAAEFDAACVSSLNGGSTCNLYIGVHGHDSHNSTFMITATTMDSPKEFTTIPEAVPVPSFVNDSEWAYFQARVSTDTAHSLYATLDSVTGDADLFVNLGKNYFPNHTTYDKRSTQSLGLDQVAFTSQDDVFCTKCTMNIAVYGYRPSLFNIMYSTSNSVQQLQDSIPVTNYVQAGNYSYYYFTVTQPDQDIFFSLAAVSGDVNLCVDVYDPKFPHVLPTMSSATWVTYSVFGNDLSISHTDPNFKEGVYIVGVYGSRASQFVLVGTANASPIISIGTDAPQFNRLITDSGNGPVCKYYRYTWGVAGSVPPALSVSAVALSGMVNLYATNAYDGSDASLPNSRNKNPCTQKLPRGGLMTLDPFWLGSCISSANTTWTFGVCLPDGYGSTATDSEFVIHIGYKNAPTLLLAGYPSALRNVEANYTQMFYYPVFDTTRDVMVDLTVDSGDADIVGSFAYTDPHCYIPTNSYIPVCTHYSWLSNNFGDDALNISTSDSAYPKSPSTLYIGVFGFTTSTFSVVVRQGSGNENDPIHLLDGRPQNAVTTSVKICETRDPVTGNCIGDFATGRGAYFTFDVPAGMYRGDAYLLVNKLCGNVTGTCPPNLELYLNGCPSNQCTQADMYPSRLSYNVTTYIGDETGALHLQREHVRCYQDSNTDCTFYVGVFSKCHGLGCSHASFSIEYTTPKGTDVVPSECIQSGGLCVLPVSSYGATTAHRTYEMFLGGSHTTSTIIAEACVGSATLAVCYGNAKVSKCADPTHPQDTPGNYDKRMPEQAPTGLAQINVTTSGLLYATVMTSDTSNPSDYAYRLSVGQGEIPILTFAAAAGTGVVAEDLTSATVMWQRAKAYYFDPSTSGAVVQRSDVHKRALARPPVQMQGEEYFVYAIPQTLYPSNTHGETACGSELAFLYAAQYCAANSCRSAPVVANVTNSNTATLTGLINGVDYIISVVAVCRDGCAPSPVQGQEAGSPSISFRLGSSVSPAPSPSPGSSPSPSRTPTVSVSPSVTPTRTPSTGSSPTPSPTKSWSNTPTPSPSTGAPGKQPSHGMSGGTIAAIVVPVVIVVGAAAGGVFWWYKRRSSGPSQYADAGFYPATSAESSYAPL